MAAFYAFIMLDIFFRFFLIRSGAAQNAAGVAAHYHNFIPFKTIWGYLSGGIRVSQAAVVRNLLGNVLVFVPYGLYLQTLLKNKAFAKSLLLVAATSVAVETTQLVFGLGTFDIDDVILNCLGGVIGIMFYKLLLRFLGQESKAKTAVTILSLGAGLPVIFVYLSALRF